MKRPYLIQRCEIQGWDEGAMVSEFLRLDYMGSAEFEFGAIPACLRRFGEKLSRMEINRFPGGFMLSLPEDAAPYREELLKLSGTGENRLKEYISLIDVISGFPNREYYKDNFWFDIENDIALALTQHDLEHFASAVTNSVIYMNIQKANK